MDFMRDSTKMAFRHNWRGSYIPSEKKPNIQKLKMNMLFKLWSKKSLKVS